MDSAEIIEFINVECSQSPLQLLNELKLITNDSYKFLITAVQHGGYVAGGFAALMAKCMLIENDHVALRRLVLNHITNNGDIDVWFPNAQSLATFESSDVVKHMLTSPEICTMKPTITKTATEFVMHNRERIQVIKHYLMPMKEQLSRFDIYNAMVAFDHNPRFMMPEHWMSLEKERMLHVHVWKSPWTVGRFMKYMNRKNYKTVTEGTAVGVKQAVTDALTWAEANKNLVSTTPRENPVLEAELLVSYRPYKSYVPVVCAPQETPEYKRGIMGNPFRKYAMENRGYLLKVIKKALPKMTNEDLMELSAVLGTHDGYDAALSTIMSRMNLPGLT